MLRPPTVTASTSGLSRAPPQAGARHVAHVALVPLPGPLRLGVGVAALQPLHHAFEAGVVGALAAVPVAVADVDLVVASRSRIVFCARAGSARHGVSRSKPSCSPSASSRRRKYSLVWPPDHGWIAPSRRLSSGSGTTSSGSTSFRVPSPVQSGQAP